MKLQMMLAVTLLLTACSDETATIEPETIKDCLKIESIRKRGECKLQAVEKALDTTKQNKKQAIGNGEINNIDW
jgi:hypothetical protein